MVLNKEVTIALTEKFFHCSDPLAYIISKLKIDDIYCPKAKALRIKGIFGVKC